MSMPSDVPSIVALVGLHQASISLTNGERKNSIGEYSLVLPAPRQLVD
jgi:hypothetical protein